MLGRPLGRHPVDPDLELDRNRTFPVLFYALWLVLPGLALSTGATAYPGEDRIQLSATHRFSQQSPGQRVFFVAAPISYVCNPATGAIVRHTGYGFDLAQQASPSLNGVPVITQLSGCSMIYTAGTSQRGGILSVEITIDDDGEAINLLHQIHVVNVP